jgi:glycosyltransferase involved in cell wall biosynthesis
MVAESASPAPLISFVLHKFSHGGSDRVAAYLAKGFVDAGYRVELVVFGRGGEVEQVLLDLLGDVPVLFLGKLGQHRALDLLRGLPALVGYLRRNRPAVLLSTANNTSLICASALVLASVRRTRLVLKTTNPIASSRHRGWMKRMRLWSYRQVFRRTSAVWTLSEDEGEEMRVAFPSDARLFRSIVQPYVTPRMLTQRTEAASPEDGPTVLSIARLTKQKRLDLLIRAFAHVRIANARLIILGEGEEREQLLSLAQQLGVENQVEMPGYVADVSAALHQADLFVLTSDYEGLPAALIEAMAANCPILVSDCFPSARSLTSGLEGCALIEGGLPQALARQIDEMLQRTRPTNLVSVAERYSIANGVLSHVNELKLVLQEAKSPKGLWPGSGIGG